jgi:hypothetical protein
MPRLQGIKERHHQPYYDHLIRIDANGTPSPTVGATVNLFASASNLGQLQWTNMVTAGQLPSTQSYLILAMRVFMQFIGTSALLMYQLVATQLHLRLILGNKPQFEAPAWYFPQGGGIWGNDSTTPAMCNGFPSSEAVLNFGVPIAMPAMQNFYVEAQCLDIGSTSVRSTYLNATSSIGSRQIAVFIDGLHTRDVL